MLLKNGATDDNPDKQGKCAKITFKKRIRIMFRILKRPVKTRQQKVLAVRNEEKNSKRRHTKFELSTTESKD